MTLLPMLHAAVATLLIGAPLQGALVPQQDLVIENAAEIDMRKYYPVAARRAGAQTRVTATCRVRKDRGLECRDAAIDLPGITGPKAWLQPEFDTQFTQATIDLLAKFRVAPRLRSGGDSVGREAKIAINWAL